MLLIKESCEIHVCAENKTEERSLVERTFGVIAHNFRYDGSAISSSATFGERSKDLSPKETENELLEETPLDNCNSLFCHELVKPKYQADGEFIVNNGWCIFHFVCNLDPLNGKTKKSRIDISDTDNESEDNTRALLGALAHDTEGRKTPAKMQNSSWEGKDNF